jgi:hypothetical protein
MENILVGFVIAMLISAGALAYSRKGRKIICSYTKGNDLSITYPYNGEYDSRNIGLVRWCSINETATLIGS